MRCVCAWKIGLKLQVISNALENCDFEWHANYVYLCFRIALMLDLCNAQQPRVVIHQEGQPSVHPLVSN